MSMLEGFTQGINIKIIGSSNLGDTMSEAVSQMDRFKASAKNLMKIGGWALGVGTALAGFATMAVMATTDTTKALGEMAAIGFKDIKSLERAAADFSNQFAGYTKPEFIAAAYDIKSAIYTLSDAAIGEYTKIAALTAKATKATVAQMTSLFGTGYGIYKDFYRDLSDFDFAGMLSGGIAQAVVSFKTTGPELAGAISNLGAAATSAKRPLEEQLTVLGLLSATMSGPESGTMYKAFMKSAAEAGEKLKIGFVDARNNLLPIADILERIKRKYGETVDAMEKIELQEAFGRIESLGVVDLLMPKIADIRTNLATLKQAMQGGTATTLQMAQAMNEDLGASFSILKQRMHNTFEVLGSAILPVVAPIIESVSRVVLAFQKWGEAHPGIIKLGMGVALIGGAVLTVLGGLALAGGMLQLGLAGVIGLAASLGIGTAASLTFATALGGLAGALWATISPLLPIVAAAGILYLAWRTNFLGLRDTTVAVWTALSAVFGSLKDTILSVWNVIAPIFGGWLSSLSEWFTAWNDGLSGAKSPLLKFAGLIAYAVGFSIGILARLFGWFREHKALGTGLGLVFAGGVFGIFKYVKATGGLVNAVSVLPYYLRVAGAELKYLTMKMAAFNPAAAASRIKTAFVSMATSVRGSVLSMRTTLVNGLTSARNFATGMARATASWTVGFAKGVGFAAKQLGHFTLGLLKAIVQTGLFIVRMIAAKVAMVAGAVATGVVTAAQWALNIAMSMNPIGLVIAAVALLIGGIVLLYKHWDTVWAGMKAAVDWVWAGLKSGWEAVVVFFRTGFDWLSTVTQSVAASLAGVFGGIWSSVKSGFTAMLDWIIGKINGLLGGLGSLTGLVGIEIPLIPKIAAGAELMTATSEPINAPISVLTPVLINPAITHQAATNADTFKPTSSSSVVTNAITTSRSNQTVHVDRSIRDVHITINAAGQDSKSIKDQLLEVFAELAAQGDGLEGVTINA